MVDPIQIINNTGSVTIQSSELTISIILVIATFVGIGVAIAGVFYSNKQTKKSNELTEMELKSRLRPWILIADITPTFITLITGGKIRYNDPIVKQISKNQIATVTFGSEIKNVGLAPTTKIIGKWILGKSKIQRKDFDHANEDPPFVLMVNESYPTSFQIAGIDFNNLGTQPMYQGLQIFYQINDKKIGVISKIYQIGYGGGLILDYWYEEKIS